VGEEREGDRGGERQSERAHLAPQGRGGGALIVLGETLPRAEEHIRQQRLAALRPLRPRVKKLP